MNESMKYVYDVLHKCYFGKEINAAKVHSCKKNLVACMWTNILASHLWFLYAISWPPPHYHQNVSPIYICIVFIYFHASICICNLPPLQKFSWVDWYIIVSEKLIRGSNHVDCFFLYREIRIVMLHLTVNVKFITRVNHQNGKSYIRIDIYFSCGGWIFL